MNMLKKTAHKILIAWSLVLCALPARAQNSDINSAYKAYTPDTVFGIGDISQQGTAVNKSMGGIGIASRDTRTINYLNPAAVTARESQSFMLDFGLAQGNRFYKQHDIRSSNNTFNIYDIVLSFPIYRNLAMYGGITPFSDIGYSFSAAVTDPAIIGQTGNITYSAAGYGSLYNLFFGAGMNLFKGFSAGVEMEYVFGNLKKTNSQVFSESGFRSVYGGFDMSLHGTMAKAGLQYQFPLSGAVSATVGATCRLGTGIKGFVDEFRYTSVSSVADTLVSNKDTLQNNPGRVKFGDEIGVGIALRGGDRWSAEVNYLRSDWSGSGMDKVRGFSVSGASTFSATASQSVRAGISFIPNRNDIRYYLRRVTYRGGAYWDQAYYKLDGNTVNTVGLTFGVTFPVLRWSNGVTLGVDLGQRGSTNGNMVRERFLKFNIGINIFDIWFIKPRYD